MRSPDGCRIRRPQTCFHPKPSPKLAKNTSELPPTTLRHITRGSHFISRTNAPYWKSGISATDPILPAGSVWPIPNVYWSDPADRQPLIVRFGFPPGEQIGCPVLLLRVLVLSLSKSSSSCIPAPSARGDVRLLWLRLFLSDRISGHLPVPSGHRTVDQLELD